MGEKLYKEKLYKENKNSRRESLRNRSQPRIETPYDRFMREQERILNPLDPYLNGTLPDHYRKPENKTAPEIKDKHLGTWKEAVSSADLIGGHMVKSFEEYHEATAWASITIPEINADGGVIIRENNLYYIYTIKSKAWIEGFTRKNIEKGLDEILTNKSEIKDIKCFITKDGYIAPITSGISTYPGRPKYIVEKDKEKRRRTQSTRIPDILGYKRIVTDIKRGDLHLDRARSLNLFKGLLKATAIARIKQNRKELRNLTSLYSIRYEGEENWARLRKIIEKDQELTGKKNEIESTISRLNLFDGMMGATQYSQSLKSGYYRQVEKIQKVRMAIRKDYPALNALDTSEIKKTTTNDDLYKRMVAGFEDIKNALAHVEKQVQEDRIPLFKLGPVVDYVKSTMEITQEKADKGDNLSKAALDWLADKDLTDKLIRYSGTAGTLTLSILSAISSGGASLLLGSLAFSTGAATSVYEFNQAESLYSVAKAQRAGKELLSEQSYEDAKLNYILGWTNLVLAGLDIGLVTKGIKGLSGGQTLLNRLMSLPGSEVLSELTPLQINRFFNLKQFQKIGKSQKAGQVLKTLEKELDGNTFKKAIKYFNHSEIDNISKIAIKGYDDLTAKTFEKMRKVYPDKPLQDHHWILQSIISGKKPHDIKSVLKKLDIDITKAKWNRAFIPHEGKHTKEYFDFIEEELDIIYRAYNLSGQSMSKKMMEEALEDLVKRIKQEIINEKLYMYHLK